MTDALKHARDAGAYAARIETIADVLGRVETAMERHDFDEAMSWLKLAREFAVTEEITA